MQFSAMNLFSCGEILHRVRVKSPAKKVENACFEIDIFINNFRFIISFKEAIYFQFHQKFSSFFGQKQENYMNFTNIPFYALHFLLLLLFIISIFTQNPFCGSEWNLNLHITRFKIVRGKTYRDALQDRIFINVFLVQKVNLFFLERIGDWFCT